MLTFGQPTISEKDVARGHVVHFRILYPLTFLWNCWR